MNSLLFPAPTPEPEGVPRTYQHLFDQGKWWKQGDETWIKVKDMSPSHRVNTAALLMRNAAMVQFQYDVSVMRLIYDAPDDVFDSFTSQLIEDPQEWLTQTKLYRSLIKMRKADRR